MNEDETILTMMKATAIAEGLRLLIDKLQQSEYQHDAVYRSLLAFLSDLHWQHYKIQTSHKLEYDLFGNLRIKSDDKRQTLNFN